MLNLHSKFSSLLSKILLQPHGNSKVAYRPSVPVGNVLRINYLFLLSRRLSVNHTILNSFFFYQISSAANEMFLQCFPIRDGLAQRATKIALETLRRSSYPLINRFPAKFTHFSRSKPVPKVC